MTSILSALAIAAAAPAIVVASVLATLLRDHHQRRLRRLERQWMRDYRALGRTR
ncbi:hypothetical protein NSA19_02770 [Actinomyces bowdenii]|uniref:hypothetical protein n=1 Tax=Actinomyces bowdenii TaxID=131109 RepID=UPI00214C9F80|nr:hypothetical protein [Actinomyces bowdenii]MCR2051792.1 hypothetical protein [Actinomyces bowdenii]